MSSQNAPILSPANITKICVALQIPSYYTEEELRARNTSPSFLTRAPTKIPGFYVTPDIPRHIISAVNNSEKLGLSESLIAVTDLSFNGDCEDYFALTDKYAYCRINRGKLKNYRYKLSLEEIRLRELLPYDDGLFCGVTVGRDILVCSRNNAVIKPFGFALLKMLSGGVDSRECTQNSLQNIQSTSTENETAFTKRLAQTSTIANEEHVVKQERPQDFKPPFEGHYDKQTLMEVIAIAERYRLSRFISIAPHIRLHKVNTILHLCGSEEIEPYSIFVVLDNTLLQSAKDFLIVTKDFLYAKRSSSSVDKFKLSEIRKVHSEGRNFYVNNYKFQSFSYLQEWEATVFVDFLQELIPFLCKTKNRSNYASEQLQKAITYCIEESFTHALSVLERNINKSNDKATVSIFGLLKNCFLIILSNYQERNFCGQRSSFHQYLVAYCITVPYALSQTVSPKLYPLVMSACGFSLLSLVDIGKSRYELEVKYSEETYLNLMNKVIENSQRPLDYIDLLETLSSDSKDDIQAIELARDCLADITEIFQKTFK
jgi:hypothetical protein